MIRLKRVLPPDEIVKKSEAITSEIVEYLRERGGGTTQSAQAPLGGKKDPELGKLVSKYSSEALGLKQYLLLETHDKCAYCESKITHVDYGDIEHIVPKSVRPDLAVSLDNLTIACGVCNTKKSDYYNKLMPLVDPHIDDGRRELVFFGWSIAESRCGAKGRFTLRELDLNRAPLNARREKHFNQLGELVSSWEREKDSQIKFALLLTIWDHADEAAEYTSMSQTALAHFEVEELP